MAPTQTPALGPYLSRAESLKNAYPPLIQLFDKLSEFNDQGRQIVDSTYKNEYRLSPGRCALLEFGDTSISHTHFDLPGDLRLHFQKLKASNQDTGACRLYVLEDLHPEFIEVLGDNLGVDPHVFAEQTNAWYFTDVRSIAHRQLASLNRPEESFTLRYHELRKPDPECRNDLTVLSHQMSFAINRRLYEPWIVVESPSMPTDDSVALVRRCASFWTSQKKNDSSKAGWNALLLVDPPFNVSRSRKPDGKGSEKCHSRRNYFFKGEEFDSRGDLWESEDRDLIASFKLRKVPHSSEPYHKGCTTLYPLSFSSQGRLDTAEFIANTEQRDMTSPFDETIFYWKNLSTEQEIRDVRTSSVSSANHLLKFISYHWIHTLELISHTLAQSEYFSDDNPATRPKHMTTAEWRNEFYKVVKASHNINYFRRKMIYFESNMALNLERLGTSLDCDYQVEGLPRVIMDAQKDFKVLASRLRPLRERANNLSNVANDIASLRAAFQAIEDSASGLSLSILATVIFPFTLVASMLSMADQFKPGESQFWIFFAVSIPLTAVIVLFLVVSRNQEYWRDRGVHAVRNITQKKNTRAQQKDVKQSKRTELPL